MRDEKQEPECPKSSIDQSFYATRPTGATVFMRTFLPWQIWKFIKINSRMMLLISRSHESHAPVQKRQGEPKSKALGKTA